MRKIYSLNAVAFIVAVLISCSGCKPEDPFGNTDCATLHQGYIKVINNYQGSVRVYIDKTNIYSNNYDLLVPNSEIWVITTGTGTHAYTIVDESGTIIDQAQIAINNNCDTVVISNTGSGGGSGGGSTCVTGNWGTIKIQNSYGSIIRVYIDATNIYSNNYNLLVPVGQTRYLYNQSVGPHKYAVLDQSGTIVDQAQVQINTACDSALISKNVPVFSSTSYASGCTTGNWGIIKVQNVYNETIRVYINKSSVYSNNYDMLVPPSQTRFYYSAVQGKHNFTILDETGTTRDKAQVYINNACDTTVIGPFTANQTGASTANGCNGYGWGILRVVNTRSERVRVYINPTSVYSNNYNMMLPPNSTRFYYLNTGAGSYTVIDESSTIIDQAQFNITQDCDTAVITVN